jgi:purple acid phosphatase-like protein
VTARLIVAAAVSLLSTRVAAQVLPPAKHTAHVRILEAPRLELATDHLAIVRWTTDNPGGSDVHYGVIRYGIDPLHLDRTAKSPIRLNRGHRRTTFRVRLDDLEPRTTYSYRVACEESSGKSDGVRSAIYEFTTPARGERVAAIPRRK